MFHTSLCEQRKASYALISMSQNRDHLREQMDVIVTDNNALRGNNLISAMPLVPFSPHTHLEVFAAGKEKAENEAEVLSFQLKEAQDKISADEMWRIEQEFKFNAQQEEISRLKSRLDAQNKKFD